MSEHYRARGLELNDARLRMATLPWDGLGDGDGTDGGRCSTLTTEGLWVPLLAVSPDVNDDLGGVWVLPGIPSLFRRMVEAHRTLLPRGAVAATEVVYSNKGEGEIAARLAAVAEAHPTVRIGSYPNVGYRIASGGGGGDGCVDDGPATAESHRVKVELGSRDVEALAAAAAQVRDVMLGISGGADEGALRQPPPSSVA